MRIAGDLSYSRSANQSLTAFRDKTRARPAKGSGIARVQLHLLRGIDTAACPTDSTYVLRNNYAPNFACHLLAPRDRNLECVPGGIRVGMFLGLWDYLPRLYYMERCGVEL